VEKAPIKRHLNILYTNADCFINKRLELDILLKTVLNKPQIIAITEVKNKRNGDINTAELNIKGV
jgi:hypothetical protein